MADTARYTIELELRQAGRDDLADKIAAKNDALTKGLIRSADLSKKADQERAKGNEEAANRFATAAALQERANQRLTRSIEQESEKAKKETEGLSGAIGQLGSAFNAIPGPAGQVASGIASIAQSALTAANPLLIVAGVITGLLTANIASARGFAENSKEIENIRRTVGGAVSTISALLATFKAAGNSGGDLTDVLAQISQVVSDARNNIGDARKTLEALNITKLDNLDSVVKQVLKGVAELPATFEKATAQSKLLGEQGSRQIAALAEQVAKVEEFQRKYGQTSESTLATARTLNATLLETSIAYETISNTLGEKATPGLQQSAKSFNELLGAIAKSESAKQFFADFANGIGTVVTAISKVVSAGVAISDFFEGLKSKIGSLGPIFEQLTQNTGGLGVALDLIVNPLKLIGDLFGSGARQQAAQIAIQKEYEAGVRKQAEAQRLANEEQKKGILTQDQALKQLKDLTDANNQRITDLNRNAALELAQIKASVSARTKTEEDAAKESLQIQLRLNNDLLATRMQFVLQVQGLNNRVKGESLDLNKALVDADNARRQQEVDNINSSTTAQDNANKAIIASFDKTNEEILKGEQEKLTELAALKRDQTLTEEEEATKRAAIVADKNEKILENEKNRLATIKALFGDKSRDFAQQEKVVEKATEDRINSQINLERAGANQAVADVTRSLEIRKNAIGAYLQQINTLFQQGKRSQQELNDTVLRATIVSLSDELLLINSQIAAKIKSKASDEEINALVAKRVSLQDQLLLKSQEAKDRSAENAQAAIEAAGAEEARVARAGALALQASAAVGQALADLSSRFAVGAGESLESLEQKERDVVDALKEVARIEGFLNDAITQAERAILEDSARMIAGKIADIRKSEEAKANIAISNDIISRAQQVADELEKIKENETRRKEEIERNYNRALKRIEEERQTATLAAQKATDEAIKKASEDLERTNAEIAGREKRRAEQDQSEITQITIDGIAKRKQAELDAEEKASKQKIEDALDLARKQGEISDKEAELAAERAKPRTAETDANIKKIEADLAKLKSEAESITAKAEARQQRNAARAKALSDAEDKAKKAREGVTDPEKLKEIDAILAADRKRINDQFDIEEELQDELEEARRLGSQAAIEIIEEQIRKQKELKDQEFEIEKQRIQAQAAEKKRVDDLEAERQRQADKARLDAIQTRLDDELAKIKDNLQKTLDALKDQLDKEKNARIRAIADVETETNNSLNRIKEQYGDLFKTINLGSIQGVKDFTALLNVIAQITKEAKAAKEAAEALFKSGQLPSDKSKSGSGGSSANNAGVGGFNITTNQQPPENPQSPGSKQPPTRVKFPGSQPSEPTPPKPETQPIGQSTEKNLIVQIPLKIELVKNINQLKEADFENLIVNTLRNYLRTNENKNIIKKVLKEFNEDERLKSFGSTPILGR